MTDDDWEYVEESFLSSVWPLLAGDQVCFHDDDCAIHGGDDCTCEPVTCRGPTCFA